MFYLGSIQGGSGLSNNAGGSLSPSNYSFPSGAASPSGFLIPNTIKSIYLVPEVAGLSFEIGIPTSPTGFFNPGTSRQLAGPLVASSINGPYRLINAETKCQVVVSNPADAVVRVRVYGSPTT